MDTNQIIQFCTIVECETISRAASFLHITPGALSRSMKRFEEELGFSLFVPQGRNVLVSEKGRVFYSQGKRILEQVQSTLEFVEAKEIVPSQIVKIASFEVFTSHFLGKVIQDYFPKESFLVHELTPSHIERAVSEGTVDFGITYIPFPNSDLEIQQVSDFRMGAYAKKDQFRSISFQEIPFAVPITSLGINIASVDSLDMWPRNVPRFVKYHFQLLETVLDVCIRGLAAAYIPNFIVELVGTRAESLCKIEIPKAAISPKIPIYLIRRKNHPEDVIFRRLAKSIRLLTSAK